MDSTIDKAIHKTHLIHGYQSDSGYVSLMKSTFPLSKTLPLCGYAEQLSGCAGDSIEFKVSSIQSASIKTTLIKIICADPNPKGSGLIEETIQNPLVENIPPIHQPFYPGSYAKADYTKKTVTLSSFTLLATIMPTLISTEYQTILFLQSKDTKSSISLGINNNQQLAVINTENQKPLVVSTHKLKIKQWYRVFAQYDSDSQTMRMGSYPLPPANSPCVELEADNLWEATEKTNIPLDPLSLKSVMIAASLIDNPILHFNGKIESPIICKSILTPDQLQSKTQIAANELVSSWDFGQNTGSTQIIDIGISQAHGELINLPSRAMMGSSWNGNERNWTHCPSQYNAIHFHEDDIYDFNWNTSFQYTIPNNLASGVYAVKISDGEHEDKIPFFVTPKLGKPQAKMCVLASTFTYAIYGNHARPDYNDEWKAHFATRNGYPWNPADFPNYGLSTYNVHKDGSGICHASHRRPLLNMRPGYITFGNTECSGLRHFQADSHLITWLEQQGIEYDLITDQELQNHGTDMLKSYQTVVTGSHPEYHTAKMLDALTQYRQQGGNFVYLGGNGLYWKIAEHAESQGTLEVRRAEGGIRAWAAEPGEYYQAFDGEYGGLWRRNNRPPQKLAGVGFSAQGKFTGSYYRRSEDSFNNPKVSWIFEGIDEEIIGNFGLCGFGAAGFELDRVDLDLGSENNTTILASSENHDEDFVLVPEELLTHITNCPGEPVEKLIRADIAFQEIASGSKLFATGSITFCGSLLENQGDNNISKMLNNVLARFNQ